jgi:hypothetical protein
MNQSAAKVADEAEKTKNDQDDYYCPEHGVPFRLSCLSIISTNLRESIKPKI